MSHAGPGSAGASPASGAGSSLDEQVLRLECLLRRELEAEGLRVKVAVENGERVLVIGEMLVFPRRLLDGQIAEAGDPSAVDLDWLASANRSYFRNLRRFHPSLVTESAS